MLFISDCVPGNKFGKWEVVKFLRTCDKQHSQIWECKCECGLVREIPRGNLITGKTSGCLSCTRPEEKLKTRLKITDGMRFGNLIVVSLYGKLKNKTLTYLCRCDCGGERIVRSSRLANGAIVDCGCIKESKPKRSKRILEKKINFKGKHGKAEDYNPHTLYKKWTSMRERCLQPSCKAYSDYGGRGIQICEEWLDLQNGFQNFYEWAILSGWEEGLSIERDNVNGNYCPENCIWIPVQDQVYNRRNSIKIKYRGKDIFPGRLWRDLNKFSTVSYPTFLERLRKGWTIKDATTIPARKQNAK